MEVSLCQAYAYAFLQKRNRSEVYIYIYILSDIRVEVVCRYFSSRYK